MLNQTFFLKCNKCGHCNIPNIIKQDGVEYIGYHLFCNGCYDFFKVDKKDIIEV